MKFKKFNPTDSFYYISIQQHATRWTKFCDTAFHFCLKQWNASTKSNNIWHTWSTWRGKMPKLLFHCTPAQLLATVDQWCPTYCHGRHVPARCPHGIIHYISIWWQCPVSQNEGKVRMCQAAASTCYPRESEGLWNHRRWFVCLFVTTITK